jgi:hypothetical protein
MRKARQTKGSKVVEGRMETQLVDEVRSHGARLEFGGGSVKETRTKRQPCHNLHLWLA